VFRKGAFEANALSFLAATGISDIAATSAVACATARICLVCVHGFTFYG